ncbi:uncharacterized protein LOC110847593 [Folsomia candida]|uniref:uncharacterized protein LOC110847593 n=1 Tax=Folsomia candida TaxID=158441 RepID=UPI000B905640|nr:uncharacterized protein LOC110847593 [Folsomia candida]
MMVRLNPYCDSDFRSSLQFLAGVFVMLCSISILVNLLVIAEMSHFYTYWSHESVRLSPATADLILILDIIITGIQIFYGLQLFNAVAENAYSKIQRWRIPSIVLMGTRLAIIIFYMYSMPVSPYYTYFTIILVCYAIFLFWPVNQFLRDFVTIPTTEGSRLLMCVN